MHERLKKALIIHMLHLDVVQLLLNSLPVSLTYQPESRDQYHG
jgi:hypothetical protein